MSKSTKKNRSQGSRDGGAVQQFFIWHGEKIVVFAVAAVALGFAAQGLISYQRLPWHPNELVTVADTAKKGIDSSTRSAEDEGIKEFDYATHAEQIKKPVPADPYRNPPGSVWNPPFERLQD
ncbi:MAG: hypothetical protein LBI05_05235 [Planctomycetaceae bacterium]|nr:hypothetical protein [Planctomycetaceae bacterium]